MSAHTYPEVSLYIDGAWTKAAAGRHLTVLNPATSEPLGIVAHAEKADLDRALEAAQKGFEAWRKVSAFERGKVLKRASALMRERAESIAPLMTMEQGKPLAEAKGELGVAADVMEWFGEEARRAYGRVIPARADGIYQLVIKEPVGPVAAFTPWNFPVNQAVRKISAALAAGCSIILKGPEETPASCAELIRVYADAGVPAGVVQLVYGIPSEISEYLIPHPIIRKISFTGSTAVGKQLAALAGLHMKRVTMELGGHAPALVFEDADLDTAVKILAANKFRNAGQVCVAPTRFLVHESVYEPFVERFVTFAKNLKVGSGLEAVQKGAGLRTGGKRIGNKGNFFEPTVLTEVTTEMRAMNEEPFGPLALVSSFKKTEDALAEANRLPYGLAAYAYTRSAATANKVAAAVESGMMSINHHGLALPEVPFGGMKDSGYGSEGGLEAMEAYLNTKFVTQASG
jgi:succinate-semialdehyde dehydrogenase/glutarate-semialdehyde dehydrogenase